MGVTGRHGYVCECTRRSCRERIYLVPSEYGRAASLGNVVVPAHARLGAVLEVHRVSGYAIVEARREAAA